MLFRENTLVFHFKGELLHESAGELETRLNVCSEISNYVNGD